MNEIRRAMLKAADQIEKQPDSYDFGVCSAPCGTPACMIGWIGHFLGVKPERGAYTQEVHDAIGFTWGELAAHGERAGLSPCDCASDAAATIRLYADQHFPEKSVIPESVRAIFDKVEA